ncbi:hypothetical protein K4A83_13710 [Spirulina subsalsa FACHB-351]|uniref:Uncharacterized protein n=1 Tax=Spirulina subsalsa FACHB-351 TaxID=234711 RepID=A0ABT3L734_9CYAN|nr:hypothetical protein [Spirulina subsalsa]MCW6037319.1 hypothetical protein [Spirulina subsalsa FACHB-351]
MFEEAQGIPHLPDLTQPSQLVELGQWGLWGLVVLVLLLSVLGIAIALFNFSLRSDLVAQQEWLQQGTRWYGFALRALPHLSLVLVLLIFGFLGCGTLSKRYHFWEQAKVAQTAQSVAGQRMEQVSPRFYYVTQEPYSYTTFVDGRLVTVEDTQEIDRSLPLTRSQIQVTLEQEQDVQKAGQNIYLVDFVGEFQVKNTLDEQQDFFWQVHPPSDYRLLQNFRVERDGTPLIAKADNSYRFPVSLGAGEETGFRVSYQAQGAPRWVYTAYGELLSNFELAIAAQFPNADFASGIKPTETVVSGNRTRYTWTFAENVSVQNPFGVFTSTPALKNTGILPRLLLLAPAIFLWWVLLLYLSLPMSFQNIALVGGMFYAHLLALTYLSRSLPPVPTWLALSVFLLALTWGLGRKSHTVTAALVCTLTGVILPIFGLLVPYTGLTLALAGLGSVTWLAVHHWYLGSAE